VRRFRSGLARRVWRRIVTGILVLGVATGTVAAVMFLPNKGGQAAQPDCAYDNFRTATVSVDVRIAASDLNYPRLSTEMRVRIPLTTPGVDNLALGADEEPYRQVMACVLGRYRPGDEVRDHGPQVRMADGMVEVVHSGQTDVARPEVVDPQFVRLNNAWVPVVTSEVTSVVPSDDAPWYIEIFPPAGLRRATWNVTISAPDGWLSSPRPWQSAKQQPTEIQWRNIIPAFDDLVVAARLAPDTTNSVAVAASSERWLPAIWGLSWLSAFLMVYVAWGRNKVADPHAVSFERERRTARRALLPFVFLLPIVCGLAVASAILKSNDGLSAVMATYVDVGLAALAAVIAWVWWLPRVLAVLSGLVAVAGLVLARVIGGNFVFSKPQTLSLSSQILQLGSVYIVTLVLIMAAAKAFEVLLQKPGLHRRSTSRWHWLLGSVGAAILIAEETVLLLVNQARSEWLGHTPRVDPVRHYQYYLWDLFDEFTWLLLLIAAAAVWHYYARSQFETKSSTALRGAIALFVAGPMWLDIWFRSIAVPIWVAVAPIVIVIGWLFISVGLWRPVLDRLASVPTFEEARSAAKAWYTDTQQRKSVPTPVDVLLALGPGGTPQANLHKSVQFVAMPALIGGTLFCVAKWLTYPIVAVNQSDSVVLGILDTVGWEAAKWVLAAAALGLLWQHLPGRRGMIKALTPVAVYATGPLLQWGLTLRTDGAPDWLPLADAALFAVVLLIVGLRMDRAALIDVAPAGGSRFRTLINAYGLENFSARLTALLTPVLVVLAVVSAFQGGDVSFPNVDPNQLSRK
jgi:hypothetical protein